MSTFYDPVAPRQSIEPVDEILLGQWESIITRVVLEGGVSKVLAPYAYSTPPSAAMYFLSEQFQRFNMPVPDTKYLVEMFSAVVGYVDQEDPMFFFQGLTDVVMTELKKYWTFAMFGEHGEIHALAPEDFDHFTLFPKGAENWQWMLEHPGLTVPDGSPERRPGELEIMWSSFIEHLEDPRFSTFSEDYFKYFGPVVRDITHIGIWAAVVWMCSPMGAEWRVRSHPIFESAYESGEALVWWSTVYPKDQFEMLNIPLATCAICGVRKHCATHTKMPDGSVAYLCEHHYRMHEKLHPQLANYLINSVGRCMRSACEDCTADCPHASGTKPAIISTIGGRRVSDHQARGMMLGKMVSELPANIIAPEMPALLG